MTSFADLKRDRNKQHEELTKKLQSGANQNQRDETFWSLTRDAAGNGSAIIRFLPAPGDEKEPFVKIYDHGFKHTNGKYYIEKSLSTLGQKDPLGEYNSKLWNSGEEGQAQARHQKRRTHYISNIYVVKDPANPENNGKVFKYSYGPKIFEMLTNAMADDELTGDTGIKPFDLWEGANFRLVIRQDGKWPTYDKSKFENAAPLFVTKSGEPDEDKMEQVWQSEYSLQALLAPDQFKTYDELKKRLHNVLGLDEEVEEVSSMPKTRQSKPPVVHEDDDDDTFTAPATKAKPTIVESDSEENMDDWFKNLENDIE